MGFMAYKATRPSGPAPQDAAWPTPDALDSLVRYTTRIPPSEQPPIRSVGLGPTVPVPVDPFDQARVTKRPSQSSNGGSATPKSKWQLSAILITDNRRAAVINEGLVGVGDQLPGGIRVKSIERDRVVIEEPNGTAHTLIMAGGGRS